MRSLLCIAASMLISVATAKNFTLVYHHAGQHGGTTLGVQPEQLQRTIHQLRARGYRFTTSKHALENPGAERTVTIRFDDGFENVYQHAFPVMRAQGVPGTVYLILEKVSTPGYLNHAQITELRAAGWEVGSHTRSHAALPDLTPNALRWEVTPDDAHPYACLAYPFGRHDARVRRATREHYRCAASTAPGSRSTEPHALQGPLVTPWDDTLIAFRATGGLDLRAPLMLTAVTLTTLDHKGPNHRAPNFYNPAAYELHGSGRYAFDWNGNSRKNELFFRSGPFALNAAFERGHGQYDAVSLAWNTHPVTLAAGWSTLGPMVGAALALNDHGELWARYDGTLAVGLEVIPLDYTRLKIERDAQSNWQIQATYALPWNTGEGRPLRLLTGYESNWYVGSTYRVGSFEITGRFHPTQPRFGVGFASTW